MGCFTDIAVVVATIIVLKMREKYKQKQTDAILDDANDDAQDEDVIKNLDITQPSFRADIRSVA